MGICSSKKKQQTNAYTQSKSQGVISELLFINHGSGSKSAVSKSLEKGFKEQARFMKMAKRDPAMHSMIFESTDPVSRYSNKALKQAPQLSDRRPNKRLSGEIDIPETLRLRNLNK